MGAQQGRSTDETTTRRAAAPGALPQGTVTFLFTDIEGSTRQAAELGDAAWAELLDTHNRLLAEACADGGHVVNSEGDALFVVFATAVDAIRAAIAGQRAIGSHAWPDERGLRVRMGVHTGTALLREGDYVGMDVHRASRVSDAGHGGQILASEATAALVRDALPDAVDLIDLGPHRLKDLDEPQRLFQVQAADLPAEFPPLRSLDAFPNNLPVQRSSLVGREEEIATTRKLLHGDRLVTLTGIGGTGKTRLAVQVGAEELDGHPDGVFFVDLAPVADPELVAGAVADAVRLQLSGPRSTAELLLEALAQRRCLLILDNCEHLLDACADLVDRILLGCPDVHVLATSREPLEVEGEQVHRVPSLSLPDDRAGRDAAAYSDAVALFLARAHAVDSGFDLTDENVGAVVQICRRLDGIPLAIEFAAARVRHLAPADIAERLDSRFRLLTGGRRRVRRQQTLEAALDWSFDLLDEPQQRLLRRLGVFAGSFELSMVERACSGDGVEPRDVLDLVGSLVDKSLVVTEAADGHVRYRLLETVRDYAETKLHQAGEAEQYRSRHRDAYLAWLESLSWEEQYADPDVPPMVIREHDNLRAALQWSREQGRRDLVGRLAGRVHTLWQPGEGHGEEGARWLDWVLEDPQGLDLSEQAACALARSFAAMTMADPEQEQYAARAIELGTDTLGGPMVLAYGMRSIGAAIRFRMTADPAAAEDAKAAAAEGIRQAHEHGDPWLPILLEFTAQSSLLLGDLEAAEQQYTAAAAKPMPALFRDVLSSELSTCRTLLGDPVGGLEAARSERGAGLEAMRPRPSTHLAAALAEAQLGAMTDAAADLRTAIALTEAAGIFLETNECLTYAGAVALAAGRPDDASRLLAAAVNVGDAQSTPIPFRTPACYALFVGHLPLVRSALEPEAARQGRDEGRAWTKSQAWDALKAFVSDLDG